ncbi:MAG: hypothetical protein H5T64_12200 [Chloroflexi bacterium]|nr:hypothetical protein [Chloroflexota bacterium]
MYPNIACSVSGCTDPVIGQCPGYKGSCGRYYCATHSAEKLCADCARQKLEDEIAQRTYEDYLQTAERLRRDLRWVGLPIVLGALLVFGLLGLGVGQSDVGVAVAIFYGGVIVASILVLMQQRKQEEVRLQEIRETKPAFPEFYRAWKKEKNKEALMTGLAIAGVIVAGTIAAAAESSSRERRVSEIEEGVRRAMR